MSQLQQPDSSARWKAGVAILSRLRLRIDSLLDSLGDGRRERHVQTFLLLGTALVLTILISPWQQLSGVTYHAGEVATTDVKAGDNYHLEDTTITEKQRAEAEAAAPYVYEYNPRAAEDLVARFAQALAMLDDEELARNFDRNEVRDGLGQMLGVKVSMAEFRALDTVWSDRIILSELSRLARNLYRTPIIADKRLFLNDIVHGALIVDLGTGQQRRLNDPGAFRELEDALQEVELAPLTGGAPVEDLQIIRGLLLKMIQPNVVFSREATEKQRLAARRAVEPVLFQVKLGEVIIRKGERISEEKAAKLKLIFEERRPAQRMLSVVGIFGIILVLLYLPIRFARKNIRKFRASSRDLLFLSVVTVGLFVTLKISLIVSNALGGAFATLSPADFYYLIPFAVGAMLVRIVLNSEVALVYTAVTAPLIGIMFGNSLPVTLYALLGGIVGAHGVRQCADRNTIYIAGLKVGVVNVALTLGFLVLNGSIFSSQALSVLIFAFLSGIVTATLVTGTIPLVEALFHYTTDIKLLELANLNAPILRELMIRAPGTYHHSILVGTLAEAAAEAINANPLLARVAAFYHDVGKISKPQYFIENVGGGENRHDKLTPSMSALILIAHVKEGVELARENRLGQPIVDIIRQSHGTALITYFFQKAKGLETPDVQTVDERDFRYPGPKPQTREAGLVMLADCVEAASRTLTDPTPARIKGMVQKIINNIFIDGQLDECELTLKNLHEIAKSFIGILSGIFHQRIDYPEPAYKVSGGRKSEDSDREPAKTPADRGEEGKKGSGEDLKRLGIGR